MAERDPIDTLTGEQLAELDELVIFPATQTWVIAHAYEQACRELCAHGTTRGLADRFMPFDEVNELLGLDRWEQPPADGPGDSEP